MKKISFKSAALIASVTAGLTIAGVSCNDDFLNISPTGQISEAQLTSKTGIEGSLIAAYSHLNGRENRMASATNWVWGSIRGGDANKGTDPGDFTTINPIQRFEALATLDVIRDSYRGNYEGIARTNNVLRLLKTPGPDVSEADKKRISAEARFLRAHYYFQLARNFNRTPIVTEEDDYGTGIETIKNDKDLYPKIEEDMLFAYNNLPETQGAPGRANKWAAGAYLAKIYIQQKKYGEAKPLFDAVITNGQTANGKKYGLVPNYADLFKASNDNNEESVFAIQNAANTGSVNNAFPEFDLNYPYNTGPNGPGNCCGFFQPSFELVNSFRTDANGLPLLDGSYNNASNAVKTDMGIPSATAFTPDQGPLDPRLDHSVGRRGIQYLDWQPHPGADWIRNQPNGGPYSPKKYTYYKSDRGSLQDNSTWTPGYTALNYTIIRFADVLLMAAETEIMVGSLTKAAEYINMVRRRAANPSSFVMQDGKMAANYKISEYPASEFATKESAMKVLQFERKLELSGEGHRFYDLIRWGTAEKELNAYLSYDSQFLNSALGGARFTPNQDEFLPLPQEEIDLLGEGVLTQNPGGY
ncbi:RagB/SusD family nutrient uptake outer membrane protein [Arundinibacter roseus]|uniref:RagB/SusD family nutrient uptake outer membrane protein n=1 Tax=Arundinibacter roseus TaxID=2070510 RepID=A0A4R4K721_9BACT|nr:RagB/SusD family nutrient uptake outer membrane protein [Arundinibacter roseus]TDB62291.1 RagB/SusD family nutrient uptake outer membrane protein [Arundinibacter roseus]